MPTLKRLAVVSLCFISPLSTATGLNFWESSTTNSALASANGASAVDASILATTPSSMTQLERTTITGNITRYQVDTDYHILGFETDYSAADPIPAGFMVTQINDRWFFGMAAYSRTAADISIPELTRLFPETRVRPIVVSFAPSVAYKIGDFSVALTAEYLYSDYLLEQNQCGIFGNCRLEETTGNVDGWSGALSATWQINDTVSIAGTHRLSSQFSDENIEFDLPSITSAYATVKLMSGLNWHNSYSLSRWSGKRIAYTEYSDVIGLLKGSRHSKRYATSLEYQWHSFTFMGGFSLDQAIDAFGGDDKRYRLGVGYAVNHNVRLDMTAFKENYARKHIESPIGNVDVQNSGYGVGIGLTYQF